MFQIFHFVLVYALARILITDTLWPSSIAKWRIVEICSLVGEFEADILVKHFAGISIAVADVCQIANYDILIFDEKYNFLGKHNDKQFNGSIFNGALKIYSYMLRLRKYREISLDMLSYDAIYHIFYKNWQHFADVFPQIDRSKQALRLYPGGGVAWRTIGKLDLANLGAVFVTQDFIYRRLDQVNIIKTYGGPFLMKNESLRVKRQSYNKSTVVSFAHVGNPEEKGEPLFRAIVELFYRRYTHSSLRFVSIGNVQPLSRVESIGVMSQRDLDNFYYDNVDVALNLESGLGVHGWPLGIEAMMQGCVLITTDHRHDNLHNEFNFNVRQMFIEPPNAESFVEVLHRLDGNRSLLRSVGENGQRRVAELFSYEKMMKPVVDHLRRAQGDKK